MRVLGILFFYLFVCGLFAGPSVGDKRRCGEETDRADWLVFPIAFPQLLGATFTSGKLPPYSSECRKVSQ